MSQDMSIDIEALLAEVDKFAKRLAQLEDELTLKCGTSALEPAERRTVRHGRMDEAHLRGEKLKLVPLGDQAQVLGAQRDRDSHLAASLGLRFPTKPGDLDEIEKRSRSSRHASSAGLLLLRP